MKITDECINCEACISECPNTAIYNGGEGYIVQGVKHEALSEDHSYIAPELCNNCGTCKDTCAIGAIEEA